MPNKRLDALLVFTFFCLCFTPMMADAGSRSAVAAHEPVPAVRLYPSADALRQLHAERQLQADLSATAEPAGRLADEATRGRNWHKYLGYSTVALAFAAAPARSNKSLHYALAYASAAGAVATVSTGFYQHGDELQADSGLLGGVNRHAVLGGLGALAMVTAVAVADSGNEGSHSAIAITGASAMLLSIVDIRW